MSQHLRTTGTHLPADVDTARIAVTVDCHRNLRGPYTGAGSLVRSMVAGHRESVEHDPIWSLLRAHQIEVLTVAPELRAVLPHDHETLTSVAVPHERTRFYSRLRTLRIAHGLVELIRDAYPSGTVLHFVHADQCDPTDAEFLSVLLRRTDPDHLQIVVGTDDAANPQLADALERYTTAAASTSEPSPSALTAAELAARYVAGDCTSADPLLRSAYEGLDTAARQGLHDARWAELDVAGADQSLRLGAIALHAERGSDPGERGAQALRTALEYTIDVGFYDATVDYGRRGLAIVDPGRESHWWAFVTKQTTSLAALGRAAEAEELYDLVRATTTRPVMHMSAAYATAMLYTRHYADGQKDDDVARRWMNEAIAFASVLPEESERVFQSAFNRNGLALVEVHRKNLPAALELVQDALQILNSRFGPDEHRLHRSVLVFNRGQVYAGLGRLDDALADYDTVIELDPNYPEYYFDRAGLYRRLERFEQALADYDRAAQLSPPFPEVYYNRADLLLELGDVDGALAGYAYVLELQPDFVDVYVNRAGLLLELGDVEGARADVAAGLGYAPGNAHLLCARGQLAELDDDPELARRCYDDAIAADAGVVAAYAGRAGLVFTVDPQAAVADLTRALEFGQNAGLLFNRSIAALACGRTEAARADLERAHLLAPEDEDIRSAYVEANLRDEQRTTTPA